METAVETKTLRGFRQTCRVKVRFQGREIIAWLKFIHQRSDGMNESPIEDTVFLEPLGYVRTDAVELLEVLPWNDLDGLAQTIVNGLNNGAKRIQVQLEIDNRSQVFTAKLACICDLSKPFISMLTPDSIPSEQHIATDAGQEFEMHARILINDRARAFYTGLRPIWATKIYLWE